MPKNNNLSTDKKIIKPVKLNWLTRLAVFSEREYFIENLSMLVASGMPIASSLQGIESEVKSQQMRRLVGSIRQEVEDGVTLWSALEKTKFLPAYDIALIRLGEKSGRLSENLQVISIQETKERDFRNKIRAAVAYPVFVLFFVLFVGLAVSWLILPKLADIFDQFSFQLPVLTRVIIAVGSFLGQYGWQTVLIFFGSLVFLYLLLFHFSKTRFLGQNLLLRLPIARSFVQQIQLSRWGYVLGTLLEAGLPIIDALDSLQTVTTFDPYHRFYVYLKNSLENGNSFQKSFNNYKSTHRLVPMPIQQMIMAGEQSGRLAQTFLKIGVNFEKKVDNTAKSFASMLEPILLIVVGAGVAMVAMGIILPIYSLVGNLGS